MAPYGGLWHCFMLLNSLSSHHSESLRHVWAMGLRFRLLPFIHCSATMSAVMEHTHKNCLEISWFLRSRSSLSYLLSQAIFSVSNLPCITGNEIRWKHHPTWAVRASGKGLSRFCWFTEVGDSLPPPGQRGSGCLEGEDSYNVKSEGSIVNFQFDWKSRKGSIVKIQDYQLYIQAG